MSQTIYNAAGIILAGGQSRRMGQDKALLPLPGMNASFYVTHLFSILSHSCEELLLVVRDREQAGHYVSFLPENVRIVYDQEPAIGPLMGLYSGLSEIQSSYAFVTAVDTPLLQPSLVSLLLSMYEKDQLVLPIVDGIAQVLSAVYPRSCLPIIQQRLQEGRRDPRSLIRGNQVKEVTEAQLRVVDAQLRSFLNVNTPDDVTRLSQMMLEEC